MHVVLLNVELLSENVLSLKNYSFPSYLTYCRPQSHIKTEV